MKYHLKDRDISLIDRVSNITGVQYLENDCYIEVDTLLDIISDLEDKYIALGEKYDKLKKTSRPKAIDPYLEFGINEREFH